MHDPKQARRPRRTEPLSVQARETYGRTSGLRSGFEHPGVSKKASTPTHVGHRQRLRERFLNSPQALLDYELLELLLFLAVPRQDTKPLAKLLVQEFGSFAAVLSASDGRLASIKGVSAGVISALRLMREGSRRCGLSELKQTIALNHTEKAAHYCCAQMAYLDVEQFRVLYLNRKGELLRDDIQQEGTLDHATIYPREIVKRALELAAGALIIAHNHPSGDTTPSKADLEITQLLRTTLKHVGVILYDHVIVARKGWFSFKVQGLL